MAGSTRQSREVKKVAIVLRNTFRTEQQLDYVDYVEDVLNPTIEGLLSGSHESALDGMTNKAIAAQALSANVPDKAQIDDGTNTAKS